MNLRSIARTPLRVLNRRIDRAVRAAEERQERRLHEVAARLVAEKDAESAEQHRMRELQVGEIRTHVHDLDDQVRRISAQLVALEHRVAELERPPVGLAAEPADRREARGLLDEVRIEHRRVRAELATIAFYEERIARLEGARAE